MIKCGAMAILVQRRRLWNVLFLFLLLLVGVRMKEKMQQKVGMKSLLYKVCVQCLSSLILVRNAMQDNVVVVVV